MPSTNPRKSAESKTFPLTNVPKLTEAEVTKQVVGWLESRGYTCERQNVGLANYGARGKVRYGTPGQTDFIVVHPQKPAFYLEIKREGETPYEGFAIPVKAQKQKRHEWEQHNYRILKRTRGYQAFWVNSLAMLEAHMSSAPIPSHPLPSLVGNHSQGMVGAGEKV